MFYGELVKQGNHNDASVPQAIRLSFFRADILGAGFRLQREFFGRRDEYQ